MLVQLDVATERTSTLSSLEPKNRFSLLAAFSGVNRGFRRC